ncbi:MAG TPA: hypothetical protein VFP25_06425 [Nitrososphaeraceae archaeon]|nr:hypothetical protein [Nitrososphaeraceae archaeon]
MSFFNEADRIIHKNNSILDKFMGDGLMAIFGFKDNNIYDNKESVLDALNQQLNYLPSLKKLKMDGLKYGIINLALIYLISI